MGIKKKSKKKKKASSALWDMQMEAACYLQGLLAEKRALLGE